jgi:hypothetical protein
MEAEVVRTHKVTVAVMVPAVYAIVMTATATVKSVWLVVVPIERGQSGLMAVTCGDWIKIWARASAELYGVPMLLLLVILICLMLLLLRVCALVHGPIITGRWSRVG